MKIEDLYQCFLQCTGVSTDTRKIENDSLFIALKGDNFDANTFGEQAILKGAKYVLIDDKRYFTNKEKMILVPNCLQSLQELAKYHRQQLGLPIIALTGSNGKTTTKELIHVVLTKKYNTVATIGNLNNHIGVPITLLSLKYDTDIGIIEMGANHQKEIEFLCEIAKPNYGYITNFGKAHLEGFGGIEGVIKGKSEMFSYLKQNKKIAFVNLDDAIQADKTNDIERITFSQIDVNASTYIKKVSANPFVTVEFDDIVIKSHLIGLYNANNINTAIAIGNYFGVPKRHIKAAIESYIPENNRSQLLTKGTNEIILDAYNANPSSMKVALENFLQLDKQNKHIIIGDMFELGDESFAEHKAIVELLKEGDNIECNFVGNDFYANKIVKTNFNFFTTFEDFSIFFKNRKIENQIILIKGSRGMALERTLELL